jgi:hypothetical protein
MRESPKGMRGCFMGVLPHMDGAYGSGEQSTELEDAMALRGDGGVCEGPLDGVRWRAGLVRHGDVLSAWIGLTRRTARRR